MVELAGASRISLEGDLSNCRFPDDLVISRDEIGILKRNTASPPQDFVVLQLTPHTVAPILKQISSAGLKRAIIHIQIERDGILELGAYDNFHTDCVVTGPGISAATLDELKKNGILRSYARTTASRPT